MRQNVKLAAQFFSNTVANAISYCGKKIYCKKVIAMRFVECVK